MIWWLVFEKKPFQFWWEIWIQVVVILLQLYLVIWKSKLRSEANLSKRSTQNPEQHRRIFESSFLASWVIFTPMIWSSCLSWHSTPFVYCSDGDEPIKICILLQYRMSHRYSKLVVRAHMARLMQAKRARLVQAQRACPHHYLCCSSKQMEDQALYRGLLPEKKLE